MSGMSCSRRPLRPGSSRGGASSFGSGGASSGGCAFASSGSSPPCSSTLSIRREYRRPRPLQDGEAARPGRAADPDVRRCYTRLRMKATSELGEVARAQAVDELPVGRPPRGSWRFLIAYFVTFRVVLSYLSLRFQSRFRSPAAIDDLTRRKHLANARRIHRTISSLPALFIKVGQLISIMTNLL